MASLFPILSYAANAIALLRAKGKENSLPVLAFVFLLLIYEVRAPRLAVYALSAPSRPFIPVDTSDDTMNPPIAQLPARSRHPIP